MDELFVQALIGIGQFFMICCAVSAIMLAVWFIKQFFNDKQ